jgi:hypothetical protein
MKAARSPSEFPPEWSEAGLASSLPLQRRVQIIARSAFLAAAGAVTLPLTSNAEIHRKIASLIVVCGSGRICSAPLRPVVTLNDVFESL